VRLRLASSSSCQGVAQSANVIGEIPGRDAAAGNAEEFVLLGAHLDSWDVGTGAQDDGAGIVTVVEAARRIGEMPERPRRSLRVVLYANEEFGLSGGRQYALQHEATLSNHVGAIESDMGSGRAFRFESRVRTDELKPVLRIGRLLAPLGITFEGNDASGGADIGPLRERGVPVFELQQDASKYFEIHHTAADLMDRVDGRDLAFNVAAYATVAWGLAEEAPRLAWNSRKWPAAQDSVHACEWQP
jgi:Zn-dependent M28 family amino/carboxypeptidase